MSERDDGAFAVPFGQMDEAEIIAHFKRYGFTDELGHALELCADFLDLVCFAKRDGAGMCRPKKARVWAQEGDEA